MWAGVYDTLRVVFALRHFEFDFENFRRHKKFVDKEGGFKEGLPTSQGVQRLTKKVVRTTATTGRIDSREESLRDSQYI